MDAGAHGGQVVCEMDTALKVLQSWGLPASREHSDAEEAPAASSLPQPQQQNGDKGVTDWGSRLPSTRPSLASGTPPPAASECRQPLLHV